jgi:hypothetical protein
MTLLRMPLWLLPTALLLGMTLGNPSAHPWLWLAELLRSATLLGGSMVMFCMVLGQRPPPHRLTWYAPGDSLGLLLWLSGGMGLAIFPLISAASIVPSAALCWLGIFVTLARFDYRYHRTELDLRSEPHLPAGRSGAV